MSASKSDVGRLLQAALFAADKHREQRRKGARATPYVNHPLAVADRLTRIGGIDGVTILMAAILHDTIEDTETTADELASLFGPRVSALVVELTIDKLPPWQERKRVEIEQAPRLSVPARLIKLCDKASNVSDTADNPPPEWTLQRRRDYLAFAKLVVDGCRGLNAALDADFDRELAAAKRQIG